MPREPRQLDFAEAVDKQRRDGWGWRWGDMESWPTEKIFEQLLQLGIDTDAARFHQQAIAAGGFKVLREDWNAQLAAAEMDKDFWPDFPLISVRILWQRLAQDVICPELIELDLYKVVRNEIEKTTLKDVDGIPADVAVVQRLARYLQRFTPADRAARYDEIVRDGMYDYTGWLTDFIIDRGSAWPDVSTQIADVLASCEYCDHIQLHLAMALAQAGRRDDALARTNAALEAFPNDAWVKILAADVHEKLGDDPEAFRLWLQALEMVDCPGDWDAVIDRLKDVLRRTGRENELNEIIRAHPRQAAQPARQVTVARGAPRDPLALDDAPADRLTRATKIGRNEPCPCGSGKKYKKCCMP